MLSGRIFFFEAIKEVLPLQNVITQSCNDSAHTLCKKTPRAMQLYHCYQEALNVVSRKRVMECFISLIEQSDTSLNEIFYQLFIETDPLEQLKYDTETQLEFICFLLHREIPKDGITDKDKIFFLCNTCTIEEDIF